jgi:hypothetical protein
MKHCDLKVVVKYDHVICPCINHHAGDAIAFAVREN